MRTRSVQLLLLLVLASTEGVTQTFTDGPSVAVNADGRLEIFARGSDGAAWHNWQTSPGGAWVGWYSLGGGIIGAPAATINADGRLDVFVLGTDNAIFHNYQTSPGGGWSGWIYLGGSIATPPTVARNADGRLEVFARGTDCAGWHSWQEIPGNDFSPWGSLGGCFFASPSVAENADGRLELFALGGVNTAFHAWQSSPGGNWTGWSSLGGSLASTPNPGINDDGRLEIFAEGTDGAEWHAWQNTPGGGWTTWASLGGLILGSPSAILNGSEGLEIFAVNSSGSPFHDWELTPGGGWGGWNWLGGVINTNAAPAVALNFDGRQEIFGIGTDGTVFHNWQLGPATAWYGWEPLSVASNTGEVNGADVPYFLTDAQNNSRYQAGNASCYQNPPIWRGPVNGLMLVWPCGAEVNIGISGYNKKSLNAFQEAVSNWNKELFTYYARYGQSNNIPVPARLFISAGGPQTIHVYRVPDNSIPSSGGGGSKAAGRGASAVRIPACHGAAATKRQASEPQTDQPVAAPVGRGRAPQRPPAAKTRTRAPTSSDCYEPAMGDGLRERCRCERAEAARADVDRCLYAGVPGDGGGNLDQQPPSRPCAGRRAGRWTLSTLYHSRR